MRNPQRQNLVRLSALMLCVQKDFEYCGKELARYEQLGWLYTRNRQYDNITEEHWR